MRPRHISTIPKAPACETPAKGIPEHTPNSRVKNLEARWFGPSGLSCLRGQIPPDTGEPPNLSTRGSLTTRFLATRNVRAFQNQLFEWGRRLPRRDPKWDPKRTSSVVPCRLRMYMTSCVCVYICIYTHTYMCVLYSVNTLYTNAPHTKKSIAQNGVQRYVYIYIYIYI